VENVNQVLLVFNDVTNVVSRTDYPTTNLYLPEVWRMKEVLMNKCEDRNDYIRSISTKMMIKFNKYWGDTNLMMSIVVVLDPRYKMKLINFCFPIMYQLTPTVDGLGVSYYMENVLTVLKKLFEAYVPAHTASILQEIAQVNATAASFPSAIVRDVVPKVGQGRLRYEEVVTSSGLLRQIYIFILKRMSTLVVWKQILMLWHGGNTRP
jgi:hypothetical protein